MPHPASVPQPPRSVSAPPGSTPGWYVAGALLLLLRLLLLVLSVSNRKPPTGDEPEYIAVARNLIHGVGYVYKGVPWLWKPPGWPVTLAGIYAVFGEGRRTVTLFQGLFDSLTVVLATWVAWRIYRSRTAAVLTFVFVALWPPFFRESRFQQTEPLYTLGVALTLAAFVRFAQRPTAWTALASGACAALAALVRPTGLLPAAGLGLGCLLAGRASVWRQARLYVLVVLGAALVLAPWTLRNARVFHAFVPLSTGTGEQFFAGSTPETDGMWDHDRWGVLRGAVIEREKERLGRQPDVLEADHALLRAGLDNWRRDPGRSLAISVKRFWRLCFVTFERSDRGPLRVGFLGALVALYALALPAGLAGLRTGRPGWPLAGALLIAVLCSAVASTVFYTNSRYFEPVRPMLLILAAGSLARLAASAPWRKTAA